MSDKIRALPTQRRAAEIRVESWNEEERTIDVVWGTGAPVRRYNWWDDEEYDESLDMSPQSVDMSRLANGAAPVLDTHRSGGLSNQIGVVVSAEVDGTRGTAKLRMSSRPEIAGIVQDIKAGIIRNLSVGYSVQRYEITREKDKVAVYRATRWTPAEVSFVPIGADASAQSRSKTPEQAGESCAFVERSKMDEQEKPASAPDNTRAADPVPPQDKAPQVDNTTRAADIAELAAKHGMSDKAPEWIRSGKPIGDIRAAILDALVAADAQAGGARNITAGLAQEDKTRNAVVSALMARARSVDPDTRKPVQFDGGNEFRGLTLLDIARNSLERAGVRTAGMDKMTLVGRAFTQTQSDFPTLLETTMHKTLTGAYSIAPDTWSRFCSIGSVSDFRAHNRYGVGSLPNLPGVNEAGEFRNVAIPDGEKASITADTKGMIINLTRQAIVNDDLGAFVGLAAQLGRSARRTIEAAVYTYLASNPTVKGSELFTDARANLFASGSTAPRNTQTAPTVAAVELMRQAMAKQKDIGANDYLDLRPSIFVGNLAYGTEMKVVNEAQFDPTSGTKDTRPNTSRGLIRDIVETPRITTNYWYLFADPADAPVIEVAFLDGQDAPFLDQEEGFTVDGTRWKVRLDFGIAAVDWRGVVRNNGA
jgi:hypothetical protein